MRIKGIVLLLLVIVLSGCSSGYSITYNTEPTGASVVCNGTNYGYSPVTLNYTPDGNNKKSGILKTTTCTAIWSSGARKVFSDSWNLNEFPKRVMQTLQRPNVEGYSQDASFALQIKNMQYQKRQAEAAESSVYEAQRQNYQQNNNGGENCYRMMDGSYFCY